MFNPIQSTVQLFLHTVTEICAKLSARLSDTQLNNKDGEIISKVRCSDFTIYSGPDSSGLMLFKMLLPKSDQERTQNDVDVMFEVFSGIQDSILAAVSMSLNSLTVVVHYDTDNDTCDGVDIPVSIILNEENFSLFSDYIQSVDNSVSEYRSDVVFSSRICSESGEAINAGNATNETEITYSNTDEFTTTEYILKAAEDMVFSCKTSFDDLIKNWIGKRRIFIDSYLGGSDTIGCSETNAAHTSAPSDYVKHRPEVRSKCYLIPKQSDILSYLDAYYALARETARLAAAGEFALADKGMEVFFRALSHPDCRLVSINGNARLEAAVYSPAILNSLYHNLRFLRRFSGLGSGYFSLSSARSAEPLMNLAFTWMAHDKIANNFRFSTELGCWNGDMFLKAEFLVTPKVFKCGFSPADALFPFSGEPVKWYSGITPVHPSRMYMKICSYLDRFAGKSNRNEILIVGPGEENKGSVETLNEMLVNTGYHAHVSLYGVGESSENLHTGINAFLNDAVRRYDMVFILDCRGLYEYKRADPKDRYRAFADAVNKSTPLKPVSLPARSARKSNSCNYYTDTKIDFEPKSNFFMDALNSVCAVYNGMREKSGSFSGVRTPNINVMNYIGRLIRRKGTKTGQLFFYLSTPPSAETIERKLMLEDAPVQPVGEGIYSTARMTLFLSENPNKYFGARRKAADVDNQRSNLTAKKSAKRSPITPIRIPAWAFAAAVHSDVDEWLVDALVNETGYRSERQIIRDIMLHTYVELTYKNMQGEKFDISYQITSDSAYSGNELDYQQRICSFLAEFLKLSYADDWGELLDDKLPRDFMHRVSRKILTIALYCYSKNYDDLLFSSFVDNHSRLLPDRLTSPESSADGTLKIGVASVVEDKALDFVPRLYYRKILSLLNGPVYSLAVESFVRSLAQNAEKKDCKRQDPFSDAGKIAYQNVMDHIQNSCESLGCMSTHIYNNVSTR